MHTQIARLNNDEHREMSLLRQAMRDVMDVLHFIRAWVRNPRGTAALSPSSRFLAKLITRGIDPRGGPVLELGSGTGVFAAALLARGVPETALTLVERDARLARRLAQRYAQATVLSIDAARLGRGDAVPARDHQATICGLGLLTMSPAEVEAILRAALSRMDPSGAIYLFTYGRRCSIPVDVLDALDLVATRVGATLRNLPPASVFRVTRRSYDTAAIGR